MLRRIFENVSFSPPPCFDRYLQSSFPYTNSRIYTNNFFPLYVISPIFQGLKSIFLFQRSFNARRHISNVNHYSESYYFLEKYHANSSNPINIPDSYHRFLGGKNGDALSSEFFLPTERIGESVASLTTRSNRFIPAPNNLENRNDRDWNDSNDICLSSLV